ncbi:MAG: lipid-binding SYLF domain-containing protein, partial [Proteobacteria bacterium]|nr:lipid-binding SYLF domain-containing protein [Pseudomonadota bacterium]
WDPDDKDKPTSTEEVDATIAAFLKQDANMQGFFDSAHGYAVFPKIYKAAIGVGGAYGTGQVYEKGKFIGDAKLSQLTYGLQFGGQAYSEVIFFGEEDALERFKAEKMEFSAQASAVAVTAGASADAAYEHGVAIFTLAIGGLMYEASIGGQKFSFNPAE